MLIYGVGALSTLLLFCALLLDLGRFEQLKVRMQTIADAAAVGGLYDSVDGGSILRGAYNDGILNGFDMGGTLSGSYGTPTAGAYNGNSNALRVTVTATPKATFLPKAVTTLTAAATAMLVPTPCVAILGKFNTSSPSLSYLNGSTAASCPTYAGSSYNISGTTMSGNGTFFVAASSANSSGSPGTTANFGAPTIADPLSYVPAPAVGTTCTRSSSAGAVLTITTLSPGLYCGGLTIGDGASNSPTVTFNAGMYVLTGPLNEKSGTMKSNGGVTFYIANSNVGPSSILNNGGNGVLTAPTSGTWQGILFYSDRSIPAGQANLNLRNWNRSGTTIDGIFYLPNQGLIVSNITLKPVNYLAVVADYAQMNNTDFEPAANFSTLASGNPLHPIGGTVGIVE